MSDGLAKCFPIHRMKPCQMDWRKLVVPIHRMKPCQMDWRKLVGLEKMYSVEEKISYFIENQTEWETYMLIFVFIMITSICCFSFHVLFLGSAMQWTRCLICGWLINGVHANVWCKSRSVKFLTNDMGLHKYEWNSLLYLKTRQFVSIVMWYHTIKISASNFICHSNSFSKCFQFYLHYETVWFLKHGGISKQLHFIFLSFDSSGKSCLLLWIV